MSDYKELREALAASPSPGPHHIYTNPRDDNNWQANRDWHDAADPTTIAALLAERDALAKDAAGFASRLAAAEQERDKFRHQWEQQCAIAAMSTDRAAELWAQAMEKVG